MTSYFSSALNCFIDCSPKTHLIASTIFDFPPPFGPTIAVTLSAKCNLVGLAKDLKPCRVMLTSFIPTPPFFTMSKPFFQKQRSQRHSDFHPMQQDLLFFLALFCQNQDYLTLQPRALPSIWRLSKPHSI